MNPIFDEIRKKETPIKSPIGYQWLVLLIKYDLNGNATIVSNKTYPAKDSDIKGFVKGKKNKEKIEFDSEDSNSSSLF